MAAKWDAVVIGLGVMGAATTWELAGRGLHVLAMDRHDPLHSLGSSHGRTRIIREAYFEHPMYVPLVRRAWDRWHALERDTGNRLFQRAGCINIASPDSELIAGVLRSVHEHDIQHESLEREQIVDRFPALHPSPGCIGIFEPSAGILFTEPCIAALHDGARARGATLKFAETFTGWSGEDGSIVVHTNERDVRCKRLVLAMGAWLPRFVPFPLAIERQVVFWFEPLRNRADLGLHALPISLWEHAPGRLAYAFPDLGDGVKASLHHQGEVTDQESIDRVARAEDEARVRSQLAPMIPDAAGPVLSATVCSYTNTRDFHFLIDSHPADARVTLLSACSGHGFKFAPAIGELVADVVEQREAAFDLAVFGGSRLMT